MALAAINVGSPACGARSKTTITDNIARALFWPISSFLGGISSYEAFFVWRFRYYVLILPSETITSSICRAMYQNDETKLREDNGTRTATSNKKTGVFNKDALKSAATAFAGAMAGAGAVWAGEAVASRPADEVVNPETDHAEAPTIEQPAEAGVTAPEPAPQPEPAPAPQPQPEPVRQSAPTPREEPVEDRTNAGTSHGRTGGVSHGTGNQEVRILEPHNFAEAHDVRIEEVQEVQNEEGDTMRIGLGKVDQYDSMFLMDNDNNVVAAVVDVNENGRFEENEIIDLRDQHLNLQDNGTLQVVEVPDNQINVVSVEEVDVDGQTVTVAQVMMGEEHVSFVDVNQDGEVNLMLHDDNHNGTLEEDEIRDVTERHIPMPQPDDVQGSGDDMMLAHEDGLPDYSNEADITMYEA